MRLRHGIHNHILPPINSNNFHDSYQLHHLLQQPLIEKNIWIKISDSPFLANVTIEKKQVIPFAMNYVSLDYLMIPIQKTTKILPKSYQLLRSYKVSHFNNNAQLEKMPSWYLNLSFSMHQSFFLNKMLHLIYP